MGLSSAPIRFGSRLAKSLAYPMFGHGPANLVFP
jgi:hypothetical protein